MSRSSFRIFITITMVSMMLFTIASASVVTKFPPRKFTRSTGAPTTETVDFSLPRPATGPDTLIIVNGNGNGGSTVTSAVVSLNGLVLFTQKDFKKKVDTLKAAVMLLELNRLEVSIAGKPGTYITISIPTIVYTTPPGITIVEPSDSMLTRAGSVTVRGTIIDSTGTAVTLAVNGIQVPIAADNTFSTTVTLQEGINQIHIVASNEVGLSSSVDLTIRKDSTPPAVTIISPLDLLLTKNAVISVRFTATDSTAITAKLNGQTVVAENDTFRIDMPLVEGINAVAIEVTDAAGNSTEITRSVRLDTQPPVLTINMPGENHVTNDTLLRVRGTVFDSTAVGITVNGVNIPALIDSTVTYDVILQEGMNTVTIVAADSAGNSTTVVRNVRLDREIPVLTILSPRDTLVTKDTSVAFSGTVADSTQVRLTLNADTLAVDSLGSWSDTLAVSEGKNLVTLTGTDAAGNSVTATRLIIRDTQPPEIMISSPVEGLITNQLSVRFTAVIQDSTAITARINLDTVIVSPEGIVDTALVIQPGSDTLKLVATDAAGNTSERQCVVVCDTLPPTITITAPRDSLVTRKDTTTISGIVIDSVAVRLTINSDSIIVSPDGSFQKRVTVAIGANIFTILATDAAGNSATVVRFVTRDTSRATIIYDELVDSLTLASTGRADPFMIIGNIGEMGDGALTALDQLLSSDMGTDSLTEEEWAALLDRRPNSLLAVQSVDIIATPWAVELLIQTAGSHLDPQVRAMAVNALATTIYQAISSGPDTPDVNIVHVMMNVFDDTLSVEGTERTLGEIAREGFANWTGLDSGKPGDSSATMTNPATGETMTVAQYREKWWRDVGVSMVWNGATMRFQIP